MNLQAAVDAIDAFAAQLAAAGGPVGMAVSLTDREQTLAIRTYGYANQEAQIPVTEDSLFQIGSIGKSFTAFALMRQREALRLDVRRPITDFVPWFSPPQKMQPITVHDLLTHTAGIASGTESHQEPLSEAWALRKQEPGFAPGMKYFYSNLGYKLLGFALERLTGQRYAEAIAEGVFTPSGMTSSYARITDDLRPYTVVGYNRLHRERPGHPSDPWVPATWIVSESGDGSITSTPGDMAAYARMILGGGTAPGGGQVVNLESFDLISRRYIEDPNWPGEHYGYGLVVRDLDGHRVLDHSGSMVAHRAYLLVDVDAGIGVSVLASSPGHEGMGEFAMRAIRAGLEDQPMPPSPPDSRAAVPEPEYLASYQGTFTCDGRMLVVSADGPGLVADLGGERIPLILVDGAFYGEHPALAGFLLRPVRGEGSAGTSAVAAYSHGPDLWEGPMMMPATTALPDWQAYVGTYRSYNPWLPVFHVVLRAGRLFVIDPYDTLMGEEEAPLSPLGDPTSFRLGEHEWSPERIRFETIVNGVALQAIRDGGVYERVV